MSLEVQTRRITWSPEFIPGEFAKELQMAVDKAFNGQQEGLHVTVDQISVKGRYEPDIVIIYKYTIPEIESSDDRKIKHECMLTITRQEQGYDLKLVKLRLVSDLRRVIKHVRKAIRKAAAEGVIS